MSMSEFASKDDYYVSKIQERDKAIVELKAKYDALREVGDRMAMALTYAKSGYICEYRLAWEALKEQADNETP